MEQITLTNDNGEEINFFVLEETTLGGVKYYLVCDSEDESEDAEATIMKVAAEEGDEEILEMVEDEVEFEAVAKLFEELVDDADFEY